MSSAFDIAIREYKRFSESDFCREAEITESSFKGNCAHFVSYLIHQIDLNSNINFSKAVEFFEWIKSEKHTSKLEDLDKGMIFCWRKLNPPKRGDSGHVGMLMGAPSYIDDGKVICKVLDLSKEAHDNEDKPRPGLSMGDLYFIHERGVVKGVQWSSLKKKIKMTEIVFKEIKKAQF